MKFKRFRAQLRKTYTKLFLEFLNASTIHGLKVLLHATAIQHARKFWTIFLLIVIIWTHNIITVLIISFLDQPTEIRMSTNLVHVANSPVPGVAICSANKFSKSLVMDYAEQVFKAQEIYRPGLLAQNATEMSEHLLLLGGFYVYPYDDYTADIIRLVKLHNILAFMYRSPDYPTRQILRSLAPDCENIVLKALIFGKEVNASTLFLKRLTSTSVCCMFNYPRGSYLQDAEIIQRTEARSRDAEKIKFESDSVLNSIHFVLQAEPHEFTYKELTNDAFQVHIFPQSDYATIQSSTKGDVFVDFNRIVEIPIQPTFFDSSMDIKQFPPKLRNCYYPDEGQKLLNRSYYSLDECLLVCRLKSQVRYCGCVTPSMGDVLINATLCTLLELPCLQHWKSVWYGWNYFDYVFDDEDEDSLGLATGETCEYCMPTCNGVDFEITTNDLPLRASESGLYTHGVLKGLTNKKPLAIIKLYFNQRYAQATEEDIVADWVVMLNRFGGIMSFMYGFSIVSYIEMLYFFTGKWFHLLYMSLKIKVQRKWSSNSRVSPIQDDNHGNPPPEYTLYWDELKPKHLITPILKTDEIFQIYRKT